jgi:hypothetical protein
MEATDEKKIRRQVYELTASDLSRFPAWEFASDEEGDPDQDEATVRPYAQLPVDLRNGTLIVRARFSLSDGSHMYGYIYTVSSNEAWGVDFVQPVIVIGENQVPFWSGMRPPSTERIERLLGVLGKTKEQVFPLTYESDVEMMDGRPLSGTVMGFSYYTDGKITHFAT